MGSVIVVSGKGGVGKTTVAALLIKHMAAKNKYSILAIDADPDTNLPDVLGVGVEKTLGDVREGFKDEISDKMVDKKLMLESKIMGILKEGDAYDLLAMGRPEGAECYCSVNHILRVIIDNIAKNYDVVVIDAEAGLEHISRRTIRDIDVLLVVTDASLRGLKTAQRIKELAGKLQIKFKKMYVIANKVRKGDDKKMAEHASKLHLEIIGFVPYDDMVAKYDLEGVPLTDFPKTGAVSAVEEIANKLEL
jgi:CO dehydrogenase maturation factor